MTNVPSPYDLWKQAGGETDDYSRDEYRRLMFEHGHLQPLAPGEHAKPLPCGWPGRPDWLDRAHMTAEERQVELRAGAVIPPGFFDEWEEE